MSESMTPQPAHSTTESETYDNPASTPEHDVEIAVETDESSTTATDENKRASFLYRHPKERMIGGICGGLGDSFNIDPTLVRILWVVLTLGTAGAGLFAYAALWLLLPVGTAQAGLHAPATLELNERNVERAGALLVLCGGLWLLANMGILPALWNVFWQVVRLLFWPVLLIGAGLLMLNNQQAWRSRFAGARSRMQNRKARAIPSLDRDSIKDGLRRAKSRIPLKRSREDRLIFGVCGGIGRATGLDTNLIRIIWTAFSIGSVGACVLVYVLVGWLLPEEKPAIKTTYSHESDVAVIDGTIG